MYVYENTVCALPRRVNERSAFEEAFPNFSFKKVELFHPERLYCRSHILKIHAKQMSVERDIRYDLLARLCPNSTGERDEVEI